MKKNVPLFLASLLTSTCLLASPGEEASQAQTMGHKRSLSMLGIDDNPSPKKHRGHSVETEETSYWKLLPADALRAVGDYLSDRDLLSWAHVNQLHRETLVPQFLLRKVPTRVWLSGLKFDSSAQGQEARYAFVGKIMPDVMDTLLRLYKHKKPKAVAQLQQLLNAYGLLTSQENTLEDTPLWTFLRSLEGTNPKDVNPNDFHKEGPLGDGDHMFLNLLHYINSDFKVSPANLPGFVVQNDPRRISPQARMHLAFLRKQISRTTNAPAEAKIWDDILEIFDDPTPKIASSTADRYWTAANECADPVQKVAYFLKGAQLAQKHFGDPEMPNLSCLKRAVRCYFGAATADSTPESVSDLWIKSAQLSGQLIAIKPHPADFDLQRAAISCERASLCVSDPALKKAYIFESVMWWDAYKVFVGTLSPEDSYHAARAYFQAACMDLGSDESDAHFLESACLWNTSILPLPNLDGVTTDDLYQAAAANHEAAWRLEGEQDKIAFLKQSTDLWEAVLARPDADLTNHLPQAAIVFNNLGHFTQDEDEKLSYTMRSISLWEQHFHQTPTPPAQILECAARAFLNGINIAEDKEASDDIYNRYVAFLDRYVEDPENLDPDSLALAADLYAQLALETKETLHKEALLAHAAKLCDVLAQKEHQFLEQGETQS